MNARPVRTFLLLIIVIVAGVALINLITRPDVLEPVAAEEPASMLLSDVRDGNVLSLRWQQETVTAAMKNGRVVTTHFVRPDSAAAALLFQAVDERNQGGSKIRLTVLDPPISLTFLSVLSVIAFPLMLIALIYFLVLRPAQMARRQ